MKVATLLVFTLSISSVLSKDISLDELKKMALNYSYGVKSKEADLKISELNVDLAKSNLYPRLGIQAGKEWINSDILDDRDDLASVYGEVNLFNGFRDSSRIQKQKINAKSVKNDFESLKFNLGLQVESVFYKYLFAKKKLSVISSEIARTKTHSKLVKKRYSSRLITESDIIEFRLHQKKTKSMENYLKLEKEQLLSKILTITGLKEGNDLNFLGEIPHLKIDSSSSELMKDIDKSPSITKLRYQGEILDLDKTTANSGWYPSVNLRAEHGKLDEVETGIDPEITSSRILIMATWELFSGFKTIKSRELQQTNNVKIDYAKRQVKQDLSISISSMFKSLKMLEETIKYEEENERLAKKLYKKTLAEYKKGIKDSGALVDASQKITDSQNRVFQLKLNYMLTKLSLEKSVGRPLEFTLVHQ